MKKINLLPPLLLISFSNAYAGGMGPLSSQTGYMVRPFVSAEGGYTWNQTNAIIVNLVESTKTQQHASVRLAGGMLRQISEAISFTSELGLGYYGNTKRTIVADEYTNTSTIDGFDALIGFMYIYNQLSIFAKGGAMIENSIINMQYNLAKTIPGGFFFGARHILATNSEFLPEIKVGGIYNINDNTGITLSYLHTFGSTTGSDFSRTATLDVALLDKSNNYRNPTLDSILMGIQYTFA